MTLGDETTAGVNDHSTSVRVVTLVNKFAGLSYRTTQHLNGTHMEKLTNSNTTGDRGHRRIPSGHRPRASYVISSLAEKQSCNSTTCTSLGPTPVAYNTSTIQLISSTQYLRCTPFGAHLLAHLTGFLVHLLGSLLRHVVANLFMHT